MSLKREVPFAREYYRVLYNSWRGFDRRIRRRRRRRRPWTAYTNPFSFTTDTSPIRFSGHRTRTGCLTGLESMGLKYKGIHIIFTETCDSRLYIRDITGVKIINCPLSVMVDLHFTYNLECDNSLVVR